MKKITRKRFSLSKGNKSFFGSAVRFSAAIPLCLLMLGGLSFIGHSNASAATNNIEFTVGSGTATAGNTIAGDSAAADVAGDKTTITGDFADAAVSITGGDGGAAALNVAGADGGAITWTAGSVTLEAGLTVASGVAGASSAAATNVTAGADGGNASDISITFGSLNVTGGITLGDVTGAVGIGEDGTAGGLGAADAPGLKGGNGGNGSVIDLKVAGNVTATGSLTANGGIGGEGGASAGGVATGVGGVSGNGGNGSEVNMTFGSLNLTGDILLGNAATGIGGAGSTGAATAAGGNGGAGGDVNLTVTSGPVVANSLTGVAGLGGEGIIGFAGATDLVGGAGGNGGKGGDLNVHFGNNRLTLTGGGIDLTSGDGEIGGAGGANTTGDLGGGKGGNGGNGGDVSFTAGIVTVNTVANVSFTSGAGASGFIGGDNTADLGAGGVGGVGGAGGNVDVTMNSINFFTTGTLDFASGDNAAAGGNGGASTEDGKGGNGGAGGNSGNVNATVLGNIRVNDAMSLTSGAVTGVAGEGGENTDLVGGGGNGANAGNSGNVTLNSGSINASSLTLTSGEASVAGGVGGENAAGTGGGGIGGNAGNSGSITLNNKGAINVAGAFDLETGDALGSGGLGGAGTADANGGKGGDAGKSGKIEVTSNSINAAGMTITTGDGGAGEDGGAAGAGTNGASGASGNVDIKVTNNITVAGDMTLTTGDGGGGATDGAATAATAGGKSGDINITARELRVGGTLNLETGTAGPADDSAGGAAGTINLNTNVVAQTINSAAGTYKMSGLLLDAAQQQTSILGDATYNIGKLIVDGTVDRLADENDTVNGEWLNEVDGNKVYRTLTVDNLNRLNIAEYDFMLPSELKAGDRLLDINNIAPTTDSTDPTYRDNDLRINENVALDIQAPSRIKNMHRDLGSFELLHNDSEEMHVVDNDGHIIDSKGSKLDGRVMHSSVYRFVSGFDADGNLVANLDGIPGFVAYAEAQAARLALTTEAQNHVITSGLLQMNRALDADEMGVKLFTAGYGSKNRYSTGSHADLEAAGFLIGAGWGGETVDGQRLLAGLFFEAGWGNYDTFNGSRGMVDYRADGNSSYYGAGLLAKYSFPMGLYFDASLRAGSVKMDFNSDDLGYNGYADTFGNTSTTYIGGHIGAGYEWAFAESQSLDFNTRVLWSHLGSDKVVSNYGDEIDMSSTDSIRWRTGARYNYALDLGDMGTLKPFIGVAYEREFSGEAKVSVDGRRTDKTPSLGTDTGIGELGVSWQATKNFSMDLTATGNIGAREGGGGSLSLKWEF